ncbi:hypothetical protein [Pseudomonas sp. MYb185]|uniref:hypothetical protein n=1 Tax=Pseudomonas sp. MYb185 TaxID=1848729 RepID=UPI0015A91893
MTTDRLSRSLPCTHWLRRYNRSLSGQDAMTVIIVPLMLIPQSLAYAMLRALYQHAAPAAVCPVRHQQYPDAGVSVVDNVPAGHMRTAAG